ncbi:MAG TPA: DNA polymerase III subunit beta [Acidothermaceae bacterium]|nr:DNA polymerase III subunit beta [Acidothermaceae bacterium]
MKFRVERDVFAEAVAWAARSLPVRPPVPVLAGLLLEVSDSPAGLALSSFDYEVSANAQIDVTAAEAGRALVSGRLLAEISRSLPAQPVDVSVEGTRVVVSCGSARFTMPTLPVDDYPALPEMPTTAGTIGADVFAAAVSQVAIAAGRDDTLPVLTGVRIEIEDDRVTLAATDRYRLAVRELRWQPERAGLSIVALVPARTLADTAKALVGGAQVTVSLSTGGSGDGLIGFSGRGAAVQTGQRQTGQRRTTTRLLDGEYVKYRSLLPDDSAAHALLETASFVEAVKRVSLVAPRNTPVRLTFTDEQVTLEAGTTDDAQALESLDAKFVSRDGSTEEFSIAFNPTYLLDGLGAVEGETTRIDFTSPTKPAVLRGSKEADASSGDDYRYLLMPVRLSG